MPKVSVVIPIYGVEQYIERCARSLFSQTLEDVEFIFIDDCTPDKSIELLAKVIEENRDLLAERHWSVRVERMPVNSGLPAVRKRGVQLATGEYIAHCDSDDWVDREICRLLYQKAKVEDLDAVFCDHYSSDGVHNVCVHAFPTPTIDKQGAFDSMFADNRGYHSIWGGMYRAELYQRVEEYPRFNMGEDAALTAQLLFFARKVGYVRQPLYYYYQRPGSIMLSESQEKRWTGVRQLMENQALIVRFFERQGVEEKYVVYAKLTARFALEGLRCEKGFREAWRGCYPEIGHRVLFNRSIPIRPRIKFFLLDTGLHSLVYKMIGRDER